MRTRADQQTGTKPVEERTDAELDEVSAEFDREFIADTFRPMTPEESQQWQHAARKQGGRGSAPGPKPSE